MNSYWLNPVKKRYKDTYELLYKLGGLYMLLIPILGTIKCHEWSSSISFFYYLPSRDILEIMLSGVGLLFLVNAGFNRLDRVCNFIIFLAATGVVSFPCDSPNMILHILFPVLHYISAFILFSTFAFCCGYVFPMMRGMEQMTNEKIIRNNIYRVCCINIIIGLISVPLMNHFVPLFKQAIFVAECYMILFSAIGYLVQGKVIFKEKV